MPRSVTRMAGVLVFVLCGCHHEVEMTPLIERTIYVTDRFYDVEAPSTDRALVVGYGGKILDTNDGGRNWTVVASGVDKALYGKELEPKDILHGKVASPAAAKGLLAALNKYAARKGK